MTERFKQLEVRQQHLALKEAVVRAAVETAETCKKFAEKKGFELSGKGLIAAVDALTKFEAEHGMEGDESRG